MKIKRKKKAVDPLARIINIFVIVIYTITILFTSRCLAWQTNAFNLPAPGTIVNPSLEFTPLLLKGMTIYPDDPLRINFILDSGNTALSEEELDYESKKLVEYFLTSMTIPKDDLWVNLSPYEDDKIIPFELGKTALGRDLLAQDYILKQFTASLLNPKNDLGQEFWDRVYEKAYQQFNTTEIPLNTFNKVWILPDQATVYENQQTVYIIESHLKVMLDSDYLALNHSLEEKNPSAMEVGESIVREIILPEIEKEINTGKNFAPLRQIYHSLILAKWYKETISNSLLSEMYVDKRKVNGIDLPDQLFKDTIYKQYVQAYKKGVFNFVQEEYDKLSQELIPRKYFSGGFIDNDVENDFSSDTQLILDSIKGNLLDLPVNFLPEKEGEDSSMLGEKVRNMLLIPVLLASLCGSGGCSLGQKFGKTTPYPENSVMVSSMGDYAVVDLSSNSKYIYTFGLGPCFAVLIVNSQNDTVSLSHLNPSIKDHVNKMLVTSVDELKEKGINLDNSRALVVGGQDRISEKLLSEINSFLEAQGISKINVDEQYLMGLKTRNILYDIEEQVVYFPYNNTKLKLDLTSENPPVEQKIDQEQEKPDKYGGIDMNDIQVARRGNGVNIIFQSQDFKPIFDLNVEGFSPELLYVAPIKNLLPILGLK